MSLLLEALKRSEQERDKTLEGRLGQIRSAPDVVRARAPWALAIGVLLCIIGGLAFAWMRGSKPAAAPAVAASPPTDVEGPEIRPLADAAALSKRSSPTPDAQAAAQSGNAGGPPGQPASSQAKKDASPPTQADATETRPANTLDRSTPNTQTNAPTLAGAGDAPALETLPQTVQRELPELRMQIHVYSGKAADRFVVINMHRYVEGDTLAEGPKVMEIRPDGVVLRYRGHGFLLPRNQ